MIFTGFVIGYLTFFGKDDTLRKEIVADLLSGEMWVILGYTFGAMIDDNMRSEKIGANFFKHKMDSDRDRESDPDGSPPVDGDHAAQQGCDHHGP